MAAKALTAKGIEALNGDGTRQQIRDGGCHNLFLIVQPGGAKSWAWRGRLDGKPMKYTLGRFPEHSLADARDWAMEISRGRSAGVNVIEAKAKADDAANVLNSRTCDWLFDLYMNSEGGERRSGAEKRRMYDRDIKPVIGSRSIYGITHDDLAAILQTKLTIAPSMSNALQALIRRWWRWSVTTGRHLSGLTTNPAADLVKLAPVVKRTRYLNDYEAGLLMHVLDTTTSKFADPLRLALYTGARRAEVFELPWSELDLEKGLWLLPAARSKNERDHIVPLQSEMVTILKTIRDRRSNSPLVWQGGGDPDKAMSGFSKALAAVQKAMGKLAKADDREIPHWSTHDLRRTVSTGLNGLRDADDRSLISGIVVEAVINHASGARGGVAGNYNLHDYFAEKKNALRLWADHLAAIKRSAMQPSDQSLPAETQSGEG